MKRIAAIIFDLDGVIVDTARYHYLAWSRLANELGISFSAVENEKLKGISREKSLEILLKLGNQSLSEEDKTILRHKKNQWYLEYVSQMTPEDILPGVLSFMEEIRNADIKSGLGTASKNGKEVLKQLGLDQSFNAVVDGNMIKRAKPDPEIFLKGAELLQVLPAHCVVFEDSISGIKAANTAGMMSIGVGRKDILDEADFVITGFQDFNLTQLHEVYSIPYPIT